MLTRDTNILKCDCYRCTELEYATMLYYRHYDITSYRYATKCGTNVLEHGTVLNSTTS